MFGRTTDEPTYGMAGRSSSAETLRRGKGQAQDTAQCRTGHRDQLSKWSTRTNNNARPPATTKNVRTRTPTTKNTRIPTKNNRVQRYIPDLFSPEKRQHYHQNRYQLCG